MDRLNRLVLGGGLGGLLGVGQDPSEPKLGSGNHGGLARLDRQLVLLDRAVELLGLRLGFGHPNAAGGESRAFREVLGELFERFRGSLAIIERGLGLNQVGEREVGLLAVGMSGKIRLKRRDRLVELLGFPHALGHQELRVGSDPGGWVLGQPFEQFRGLVGLTIGLVGAAQVKTGVFGGLLGGLVVV